MTSKWPFSISGSLDDDLVAGVGQPVEGAVAEDVVVEETELFLHGFVGGNNEEGGPLTADWELVGVLGLLTK